MKRILCPVLLVLMLSSTGCAFFGWSENGLRTSTPRLADRDYWSKPNIDEAQRKEDWISCGGNSAGYFVFSEQEQGQSTYHDINQADKEYDAGQACMMKKGYRYTDSCRGELSRRLACKGRSIFNL